MLRAVDQPNTIDFSTRSFLPTSAVTANPGPQNKTWLITSCCSCVVAGLGRMFDACRSSRTMYNSARTPITLNCEQCAGGRLGALNEDRMQVGDPEFGAV